MRRLLARQAFARSEGGRIRNLRFWRDRGRKVDHPYYVGVGVEDPTRVNDSGITKESSEALVNAFRNCPKGHVPFFEWDGVHYRPATERTREASAWHPEYKTVIWGEDEVS